MIVLDNETLCDGNRSYNVRVLEAFPLEAPTNMSQDVVTIYSTTPACCDACPAVVSEGETYLFAGYHKILEGGECMWYLDAEDSLVSVWTPKYERKMRSWVEAGLAHRRRNNLCGHSS